MTDDAWLKKMVTDLNRPVNDLINRTSAYMVLDTDENAKGMVTAIGMVLYLHYIETLEAAQGLLAPDNPKLAKGI